MKRRRKLFVAGATTPPPEKKYIPKCHACDADLVSVFSGDMVEESLYSGQFENALHVGFRGGYGMFIESTWIGGPNASDLLICHDCAHKLCAMVPWIRKLLDPENSHAHTVEYREAHPVHYGWDYDHAREAEHA